MLAISFRLHGSKKKSRVGRKNSNKHPNNNIYLCQSKSLAGQGSCQTVRLTCGRQDYRILDATDLSPLRFRQTNKMKHKQMEIFVKTSNVHHQISLILLIYFISTIYATIFAAECLKMKSLIDICTVSCRFFFKCTGLHTLCSRSKHRPLCRISLL